MNNTTFTVVFLQTRPAYDNSCRLKNQETLTLSIHRNKEKRAGIAGVRFGGINL